MSTRNGMRLGLLLLGVVISLSVSSALAWEQYSIDGRSGYCLDCHGDFRDRSYQELGTGEPWDNSLHEIHQQMVSGDCDVCHLASGKFPVVLGDSKGGYLLDPFGCAGCHGRAEDGSGYGTEGWSAGQRQHHERAGIWMCGDCHADSNPAAFTPAGEDTPPVYYLDADGLASHPAMAQDPCSDPSNSLAPEEDYDGAPWGLDNDGDLLPDMADPDCAGVVETPGETAGQGLALMLVTGHDVGARTLDITYGAACLSGENTIVFGPLEQVHAYGYSGEECYCGNDEAFTWPSYPDPTVLDSFFFLLVANDGNVEGSYGVRSSGSERPRHTTNAACPMPQTLADRCD